MSAVQDTVVWIVGSVVSGAILGVGGMAINQIKKVLVEVESLKYEVRTVKHEVLPNGGSSIKDTVNRIEMGQALQKQALEANRLTLEQHLRDASYQMSRVDTYMEDHR